MKKDENGYKHYNVRRGGKTYYKIVAPTGEKLGEFLLIESADAAIAKHLARQQSKDRPCMKCRKTFRSQWIGNRLCKVCSQIPEGLI